MFTVLRIYYFFDCNDYIHDTKELPNFVIPKFDDVPNVCIYI